MKIALLGDTALFGKNSIDNIKVFDYFKEIREKLKEYDFVIANLETPFNLNSKPNGYKSAYISSDPKNVELLKYLGVSIVNLANNHMFDFGINAYNLTKKVLKDNNIDFFGVEGKNAFVEKEGNKISFNGFCCYSTNPLGLGKYGINELNYKDVETILKENNQLGYNTILSFHAGQEHINYPNHDHIKFARQLTRIAPYVYYGHHPHVLQGIEYYNESLLAYSLGNFCFDDVYTNKSDKPLVKQTDNNKSSIILELEYQNNKLINNKPIPFYAGIENIKIGNEKVLDNLNSYSLKLNMNKTDYVMMRNELLASFVQTRNAKRDLKWYLRRLNLRTFFVVKDLFKNQQKYNSNLKQYL